MAYRLRVVVPVLVALVVAALCAPARAQPADPIPYYDIPYILRDPVAGQGSSLLDVYLPGGGAPPYPVVLMLHGFHGAKGEFRGYVRDLTGHGWAVVAPTWRSVAGAFPQDAFCALAWVYAEAGHYGFDVERVAVFGTELGGQIAALMGAIDRPGIFIAEECPYAPPSVPPVDAVVTWGGFLGTAESLDWSGMRARWAVFAAMAPRDYNALLDEMIATPPLTWRAPGVLSDDARQVAQQFALYWINGSEPPYLLLFGKSDYDNARRDHAMFAGLVALAGVDVTLVDMTPFTQNSGTLAGQSAEVEAFLEAVFTPAAAAPESCCQR